MSTDTTYVGKYGQLRVLSTQFLKKELIEQLSEKEGPELLKNLSSTTYKQEIDSLSALYKMPDLFEAVINAHMMKMMRYVLFAMPPSAKDFVVAYLSKFDIENIKLILSSKILGYDVEQTENFLMVQRNIPAGLMGGIISGSDYKNMIAQNDIEGVVKYLAKYGYGVVLLKYLDEVKRAGNLAPMILALDKYYYERLFEEYRFHNSYEGSIREFLQEMVDIKNIVSAAKASSIGYTPSKEDFIPNGKIPEAKLAELASKGIEEIAEGIPFKIGNAIELYKERPFISFIEVALKRELYKKYMGVFERSPFSIAFMLNFMLKSEIERDELRNVWLIKFYGVRKEIAESMKVLK
ncbi:MAG: V-type ATPase subunit, partial [Candidatus Micrarchaeia archaeon]